MKKEYILNNISAVLAVIIKHAKQQLTRHSCYMKYTFPFRAAGAELVLFYNEQI